MTEEFGALTGSARLGVPIGIRVAGLATSAGISLGVLLGFSILGAAPTRAVLIEGRFEGIVDSQFVPPDIERPRFTGSYLYDDSVGPIPAQSGWPFPSATVYPAIRFEVNGLSVGPDPAIFVVDGGLLEADHFGLFIRTPVTPDRRTRLTFNFQGEWAGETLSVLDGRVLGDFYGITLFHPPIIDAYFTDPVVTSWSQSPIPEPGPAVLLMLGLSGLAAHRRRSS